MSNGSIMELVAKGQQDEDLIDINNKSSLFEYDIQKKNKYTKGDTMFYSQGSLNWGNTIRFDIEKQGDLLHGLYVKIKLPKLSINNLENIPAQDELDFNSNYRVMYTDYVGNVIVEKASLYINGLLIDELYGDYMQVYTDLYISDWNRKAMLGLDDVLNNPNLAIESEIIYVPLRFTFCTDQKKPLPVIALQNSEIYIDIKLRDFHDCISVLEIVNNEYVHSDVRHKTVQLEEIGLLGCFYYVDLEERKKLATSEYEILVTQTQVRTQELNSQSTLEIDFNHVVKDMIFFIQPKKHIKYGEYFNMSAKMKYLPNELRNISQTKLWELQPQKHLLNKARMMFNGIERIEWRDYKYYYFLQNHENYKNTLESYVYVYSFNIGPTKDSNYSGCNFSRLSNAQLQIVSQPNNFVADTNPIIRYPVYDSYILKCYATNYNVLIIKNGVCGLKYSS
jgi:hypothetical protein